MTAVLDMYTPFPKSLSLRPGPNPQRYATGPSVSARQERTARLQTAAPQSELSTVPRDIDALNNELFWLLATGRTVDFEDGMENDYRSQLNEFVFSHGVDGVLQLLFKLRGEQPELIAFTLRYLAEVRHKESELLRMDAAIQNLRHSSAVVRDGAIIALYDFMSSRTLHALENALNAEKNSFLRQELASLIAKLKKER